MKLTRHMIKDILPGTALTIRCDGIRDFQRTMRTAYYGRNIYGRDNYKVRQDADASSITIERIK